MEWLIKRGVLIFSLGFFISLVPPLYGATWIDSLTPDVIAAGSTQSLVLDGSLGDIILKPGATQVYAQNFNVNVTLQNGPINVVGNAADCQLYLRADAGRQILFNIDTSSLTFKGRTDASLSPLLIVVDGYGQVVFNITGSQNVTFTADATHGGVQLYLLMATPSGGNTPTLSFLRNSTNSLFANDNSLVQIGPKSVMSYIAPTLVTSAPTEQGIIQFDPREPNGTGRHVLDIENTGAFIATGSLVTIPGGGVTAITLADINRALAAGLNAIMRLVPNPVPVANASLEITNNNNTLSNLRINPYNLSPDPFNGILYGFILGANGTINVPSNTYIDYIGLTLNQCPFGLGDCDEVSPSSRVKERNPSALIVDGNSSPTPAQINLSACSAIVFRSGVDNNGIVGSFCPGQPFTIDPALRTPGAGNTVFDVEGAVNVVGPTGSSGLNTKLEILSWAVNPTGGRILIENATCPTIFPLRNFSKVGSSCVECQYNSANFLINGSLNLYDTSINHTDQNHLVYPENDIKSEPAYIGGDTFSTSTLTSPRPSIDFNNSKLYVHTDIAFTGVDLVVPNTHDLISDLCVNNVSQFVFYQNGKICDMGTGRNMILGTLIGSTACDGCTIISNDAHLDVIQQDSCSNSAGSIQQKLLLTTAPNDNTIVDPDPTCGCVIPADAALQFSIQSIFLGNASNISVGSQTPFANPTNPMLLIAGNFFSFVTRGGPRGIPSTSNVTGKGGIFVDNNGTFCICPQYRASFGTMVTKSGTGVVNLPRNQVYFNDNIGIAEWKLDMNDPTQQVIIPAGESLSDYTLNWIATRKNYALFMPYELGSVNTCTCPPVTSMNVSAIPTIQGEVNQLEIQGSRIGDPAVVKIDGGWVREVIFERLNYSAEASNAVFVLTNEGRLGLGTAHRNQASLEANTVLGSNGVAIIGDGNGQIELNEDFIINNVCSILRGPSTTSGITLQFTSVTPKSIRITETGVLDLHQFGPTDTLIFGGEITVVFEPGARIILDNLTTVKFIDNAVLLVDPYTPYPQAGNPNNNVTNTDSFRAKLIGSGNLLFANNARLVIPKNAFLGVETLREILGEGACTDLTMCGTSTSQLLCEVTRTNITVSLNDSGQFIVGDMDDAPAGAFQVGNTTNLGSNHRISFAFFIDGKDARVSIKTQGFLGFGVGIVDKHAATPNNWLVGSLFNVEDITIILNDGLFSHDRIYQGDNELASLLAIGDGVGGYSLQFANPSPDIPTDRTDNADFHGGGNMVRVAANVTSLGPIVTNIDGVINASYEAGMYASAFLQSMQNLSLVSSITFFNAIRTLDATLVGRGFQMANFAQGFISFRGNRTQDRVGYIGGGLMGRQDVLDIIDINGGTPGDRRRRAVEIGAVYVTLNLELPAPHPIKLVSQIQ